MIIWTVEYREELPDGEWDSSQYGVFTSKENCIKFIKEYYEDCSLEERKDNFWFYLDTEVLDANWLRTFVAGDRNITIIDKFGNEATQQPPVFDQLEQLYNSIE